MSSPIDEITALCAQACRTGSLLVRGTPAAAGWMVGWLAAEIAGLAPAHADAVLDEVLRDTFGPNYRHAVRHPVQPDADRHPHVGRVLEAMRHRRRYAEATTDIAYGPGGRSHLLDIWRRPDLPADRPAPVLIQIPGGAWSVNDKRGQAYPLMSRMVELGWICVSINYRRSPRNAWPAHIIDVKRAIAWVRANITGYGGDPEFIALTGGSAGGHLTALAALTAGDPTLQPGFEDADTSVHAAAPHYGLYDLTDRPALHPLTMPLLEHVVFKERLEDSRELFEAASPALRAHAEAPPFFILHGRDDAVVPSAQARIFRDALRSAGAGTVAYAELPRAHHAFDTIATLRCQLSAEAVATFLGIIYGRYLRMGRRGRLARRPASRVG